MAVRWADLRAERCGIARFLSVVGDRWALLILRESFRGARRFDEFLAALDISPTTLSRRLRELSDDGIFERVPYQARPVRYEYALTEKGVDLHTVFLAALAWSEKHHPDPSGFLTQLDHTRCGHELEPRPETRCGHCGDTVAPLDIRMRPRRAATSHRTAG